MFDSEKTNENVSRIGYFAIWSNICS